MKWLGILLELAKFALSTWQKKQRQKDYDKLQDNPSDWFNGHFGGVRSDKSSEKEPTKTEH